MEERTEWELVNPESIIRVAPVKMNPHPATLKGKTVLLRWNGKHNGDAFLNRIAELTVKNVPGVKIIKSWEVANETATTSSNPDTSRKFAETLAAHKPAIVIGAQGD